MSKQKNIFDDAEDYEGRTTTRGIKVPAEIANGIVEKYNEVGKVFAMPVATLNSALGIKHTNHRAGAIRKQLNRFYKNLIPNGMEWYVGTTAKDTKYVLGFREKVQEA